MATTSTEHVKSDSSAGSLKQRYESVKQRMAEAAKRAGRDGEEIILVAVTKHASIDEIRELLLLGHQDFGENRAQHLLQRAAHLDEFIERHQALKHTQPVDLPDPVRWHMIGHLQRNKVKRVLPIARLIQSLDSLRLAEEIQSGAAKFDQPIEVLVQVNISGEKSKYGLAPAACRPLLEQIDTMLNIKPRGMMCIGTHTDDEEIIRRDFIRCRELFEELRTDKYSGDSFNILSMGMTHDFEIAIECGANMVRVGSAIFGESEEEN